MKNPSTADKRKILGKAKELGSPNTIVGNPTGRRRHADRPQPTAAPPPTQTFTLPQGISGMTGKSFWSGDAVGGFKYKDAKGENSAVKSVLIRKNAIRRVFLIKVVVSRQDRNAVGRSARIPAPRGCVALVLERRRLRTACSFGAGSDAHRQGRSALQGEEADGRGLVLRDHHDHHELDLRSTTSTTLYGSPSRAFVDRVPGTARLTTGSAREDARREHARPPPSTMSPKTSAAGLMSRKAPTPCPAGMHVFSGSARAQ